MKDKQLKKMILAQNSPPVSQALKARVIAALYPNHTDVDGRYTLVYKLAGYRLHMVLLALALVLITGLTQPMWIKHWTHPEDDLHQIDPISMSSLMTL